MKIKLPPLITPVEPTLVTPVVHVEQPHTSYSQMALYLSCPKKYWFRYIERAPSFSSMALSIGKGGHSALEFNSRLKIKTGLDMEVNDLLDAASTFIDKESESVEDKEPRKGGQTKDRALAGIRIYRERDAPSINPAGVEVPFLLDLNQDDGGEPIRPVKGFIDLITERTEILDYKFVGKRKSQVEVDISPQLTLYGKVFQNLTGRYPARTGFQMFIPGNTKEAPDSEQIVREEALMTPDAQERRFKRLVNQFQMVEKGINHGVFPPTDNPITCAWCDYRVRCQSSLVDDFTAAQIKGEE